MKKILLLGAGMSSTSLIRYLLKHAPEQDWFLTVGDIQLETAAKKISGSKRAKAIHFELDNKELLENEVRNADLVISMLPFRMHPEVAAVCLRFGKNMVTASYVSDAMRAMDEEVRAHDLIFMNEIGVDPGIDHMSAMKVIHRIREEGGELISFKSSTGGLIAPESDNNPWNYKFTWNPRNVVLAGQGVSMYRQQGTYKYIPYHQLFSRIEPVTIPGYGDFEVYANRDSLKYRSTYGIEGIPTIFRGTIRRAGFCKAWNILVQLGMTSNDFMVTDSETITHREFLNTFLAWDPEKTVEEKICQFAGITEDSDEMNKLRFLDLFSDNKSGLKNATPADILQFILEEKWKLQTGDKDMIVMQHEFIFKNSGDTRKIVSSLVVTGINEDETAMAITVGIPVAIAAKRILSGQIHQRGVIVPVEKTIYEPVLEELQEYGIRFTETESIL